MNMVLRTAAADDAAALTAADALCRPRPWTVSQFTALLQQPYNRIFLTETNGNITALAVWQILADQAELHLLCTLPDYRRQGLASWLLEDFFRATEPNNIKRILLEVGAGNHAAQSLYHRCGFTENGRRKNYYPLPNGSSEDAVLMEKIC